MSMAEAAKEAPCMDAWLKCEVSAGQFSTEVAVKGTDFQGEEFSLFVPVRFVEATQVNNDWSSALLQVEVLESIGDNHLIYLPGQTFGNGQSITVRSEQLKKCSPREKV